MYLKRIEMQGFKSFADKTVIELKKGITTVIGPNGSGKSNISDAIRWVLGEQSIKSLRGTKSLDIIFAGTQNRKSLGFAECSLVFDNQDGSLPIEYQEVTVTRKIYRSGETGYYINKVPCRLKDILELFMDTGIGKDGYSIVGQGKIDEILSNKSEDRRHIFEEAAGIVKYRIRKQETEKKLEHTKLNLLRINDILSEIEGNLEPLQNQAEKAKKYLNIREELKNIEVGLFIHNIKEDKEELQKQTEAKKITKDQCDIEETKLERLKMSKENIKNELEELINKIENTSNLGFESQKQIEMLNSNISVSNTKIANNKENKERYLLEIEEKKSRLKELEEEQKQKEEKRDNLLKNKEKFSNELKEKEEELEKITNKLTNKEIEIESYKKQVEENIDNKYEKQSKIQEQEINYENNEKRQRKIKEEIEDTISELDTTRMRKEEISKEYYEIETVRNKTIKKLEETTKEKDKALNNIKTYQTKITNMTNDLRMKESRRNFLIETEKEKEGYNKSVKTLLKECEENPILKKGVEGVLANLIEVPEKFQTAIEMSLGMAMQNIVTQNEQDAKKLVEYLRKNNIGRASFLPISSVKGRQIEKIKGKENILGIASNLIKYNKKYEQIIQSLLGKTVIVEDMEKAIKLAKENSYSFKIVTLKGDIINASGAITGGAVMKKTVNILGRKTEIEKLEKEIEKLKIEIKNIKEEQEKYEEEIESTLEIAQNLEKTLQENEIEYATKKQKVTSFEEEILKLETRLKKLKDEKEEIKEEQKELIKTKEELEKEIVKLKEENEKLNTVIEEFRELNKDDQKYIDDLNFDITNLKISVSSFDESENSIEEIKERINQEIEANQKVIENKQEEIRKNDEENIELENKIKQTKEEIEKIKNEVKMSSEKIEELKEERKQKNEKLEKQEEEITEKFAIIEDLKGQLIKIETKISKTEEEIANVINKMWDEYELTPNSVEGYEKPQNIANTKKKVHELRNNLKEIGSVNIDSIEEYKNQKERYDFMSEQRLDLETTMAKLRKIVTEMTSIMKEQFKSKFKEINKNFGEVFAELFNGGKAEVKLEDEQNILECGIEITVEPPGKKLQNMMLLSGGEKALTAIALLFAILKINPAPFCVLDEIEAALDDVNVYRYADYLKKFVKDTQFLVITHRKGTMEAADSVYGVTMEENGISKLLSMKLKQD